jgi:N6-L-threonylcarbamoyladenine synthase
MSALHVLAVETSCDETSAAVLRAPGEILGHVILSQDAHALYGGVVPEIASRAHLRVIDHVVDGALREARLDLGAVDLFAATAGPGLIGALLVGHTWTHAAAFALGRPFLGVHHMEAHLFATALEHDDAVPPFKVARILGLGYPGGPEIQRHAAQGNPAAYAFPRPLLASNQLPDRTDWFDFSFSGLKTAVQVRVRELAKQHRLEAETANLAASFQAAVVDVLVAKTLRAVEWTDCPRVVLGGGVAASRALRSALVSRLAAARADAGRLHAPSLRLATDNAAMVARAALFHFQNGRRDPLDSRARADLPFPGLVRAVPAEASC